MDENVFRHRKAEIPETIIKRSYKDISYEPAGAGELFYEQDCFNALYNILRYVFSHDTNLLIINMCKLFLQLVMSSPYAVYGNVVGDIPEEFETFFDYLKRWKQRFDKEIETITDLRRNPSRFYSKLSYIIRAIDQEDPAQSKKFLIISQFPQTAVQYHKAFCKYYGRDSAVLFVGGMTPITLRDNVKKFQDSSKCRFVICDDTGGIGRNFQMADYIVHCELPWSPAILEQRIGRLDRIGRYVKKDVISLVVHSDYGIENDLFKIFSEKGLNVFNRSLCGMEIVFDEIDKLITDAFVTDPIHGLENVIEKCHLLAESMDEAVEQELYYGLAEQLDSTESRQINYLVDFFNINNNEKLFDAIRTWMINIGITDIKSDVLMPYQTPVTRINLTSADKKMMKQKVYALPFQKEIYEVVGTFDRKTAVEHENLYYIAPQTGFFESIAKCAICGDDGTITYITADSKKSWEGFVLTYFKRIWLLLFCFKTCNFNAILNIIIFRRHDRSFFQKHLF